MKKLLESQLSPEFLAKLLARAPRSAMELYYTPTNSKDLEAVHDLFAPQPEPKKKDRL
jgi:hypothetical protein